MLTKTFVVQICTDPLAPEQVQGNKTSFYFLLPMCFFFTY